MKRLVLLGGGHTHLEVLRRFGREPVAGVELVLIDPGEQALYSGMLPGFVAGHYRWDECVFDLPRLAGYARARFMRTAASAIDPERREVRCRDGGATGYDLLSIDIGSSPRTAGVPGAGEHAFALKPATLFRERLGEITDSAKARPGQLRFAVVGAGAGGIEICLALEHRMRVEAGGARFELVADGEILPGGNAGARRRLARILRERGVNLRAGCAVTEVEPGRLELSSGEHIVADHAIWVTGAAPASWLRESGLALDSGGCVQVNRCLQSTSHAQVFAAGDVAGIAGNALPKAGVHAVRQGPTLAANLRRCLRGEPPQAFRGTERALYLISAGERHAVMSWGAFALEGAWVWRWKDRIDRRFMGKYQQLQARLP